MTDMTDPTGPWMVQDDNDSVNRFVGIDSACDALTDDVRKGEAMYVSYMRWRVTLFGVPVVDIERIKTGCQWRWDVTNHSVRPTDKKEIVDDYCDQALVLARDIMYRALDDRLPAVEKTDG